MNNKAVIVTAVIASILVVGIISPIGMVYAHVNVCSSSNDHDKDGIPFSALWAAVCDLQSQIDGLQNQINNIHGGTSNSYIQVSLNNTAGCIPTPSGYTYGWCTDDLQNNFIINDPSVNLGSVIVTSTVAPHHTNEIVQCPVASTNVVDGQYSGFLVQCQYSVSKDTVLNYIIVNTPTSTNTCTPPQVLQNGVCVTPPVVCTPPQVLQNGVCVTPPVVCTPPQVLQNGVCIPQWDKDHHHAKGERVFYQKDGHNVLYTCTADVTSNTTPDNDHAHWASTTSTSDDGFSNYKNQNQR